MTCRAYKRRASRRTRVERGRGRVSKLSGKKAAWSEQTMEEHGRPIDQRVRESERKSADAA